MSKLTLTLGIAAAGMTGVIVVAPATGQAAPQVNEIIVYGTDPCPRLRRMIRA